MAYDPCVMTQPRPTPSPRPSPPARPTAAAPPPTSTPSAPPARGRGTSHTITWLLGAILVTGVAILVVLLLMYLNRSTGVTESPRRVLAEGGGAPPPVATPQPAEPRTDDKAAPSLASPPPAIASSGAGYVAPAGRSPIPGPGETVTSLIAPGRVEEQTATGARPPPRPSGNGKSNSGGMLREGNDAPSVSIIPWHEAGNYIGKQVTVEGKIVDTHNTGRVCFLNFSRDRKSGFYAIIFQDALDDFGAPPEKHFMGKTIRVTGEVATRDGRPQIQVRNSSQISMAP